MRPEPSRRMPLLQNAGICIVMSVTVFNSFLQLVVAQTMISGERVPAVRSPGSFIIARRLTAHPTSHCSRPVQRASFATLRRVSVCHPLRLKAPLLRIAPRRARRRRSASSSAAPAVSW